MSKVFINMNQHQCYQSTRTVKDSLVKIMPARFSVILLLFMANSGKMNLILLYCTHYHRNINRKIKGWIWILIHMEVTFGRSFYRIMLYKDFKIKVYHAISGWMIDDLGLIHYVIGIYLQFVTLSCQEPFDVLTWNKLNPSQNTF